MFNIFSLCNTTLTIAHCIFVSSLPITNDIAVEPSLGIFALLRLSVYHYIKITSQRTTIITLAITSVVEN